MLGNLKKKKDNNDKTKTKTSCFYPHNTLVRVPNLVTLVRSRVIGFE